MDNPNIFKLLNSDLYIERLQGEYYELLERRNKLSSMLHKYDRGELDFTPTTAITVLRAQLSAMDTYLNILDYRLDLENKI